MPPAERQALERQLDDVGRQLAHAFSGLAECLAAIRQGDATALRLARQVRDLYARLGIPAGPVAIEITRREGGHILEPWDVEPVASAPPSRRARYTR